VTVHFIRRTGRGPKTRWMMLPLSTRIRAPSTPKIPARPKPNFSSPFNPIAPVQISREKYSALRFPQISRTLPRIPPHEEGRFAIVTNVEAGCGGRDGSRACLAPTNELIRLREDGDGTGTRPVASVLARGFRGRPSRVVLAPRRWR
jgi:hypothetical protein